MRIQHLTHVAQGIIGNNCAEETYRMILKALRRYKPTWDIPTGPSKLILHLVSRRNVQLRSFLDRIINRDVGFLDQGLVRDY